MDLKEKEKEKRHINNSYRPTPDVGFGCQPHGNKSCDGTEEFEIAHWIAEYLKKNVVDIEEAQLIVI